VKEDGSKPTEIEKPKIIKGVEAIARIAIREMLEKELSLRIGRVENDEGTGSAPYVIVELLLAGDPIGKSFCLTPELSWKTDHRHGGGSYVNGVRLEIEELKTS